MLPAVLSAVLGLLLLGGGLLAAAEPTPPAEAPPSAQERRVAAFGNPCGDSLPQPPFALAAPYDAQFVRFTAARCHGAAGQWDEAVQRFRQGLAEQPHYAPLWHWSLLQALVLAEAHEAALRQMEALLTPAPGRELTDRVRGLVMALAVAPGLAPKTWRRHYLVAYLEHVTPRVEDYDLLYRLWELSPAPSAAADAKLEPSMRDGLALLLWRNPKDEAAAKHWAQVLRQRPEAPAPTGADRLGRAERLFALGSFDLLIAELEDPALPPGEPDYAKALGRLYFRALIRGKQLPRAAVQIHTEAVLARFAFDARQQLIWAIRIQLRRRMVGPALKYLEELERIAPKDEELPSIYLELLKYNQGRRDAVTVLHWLGRLATEQPTAAETSDAYWQVIWNAIERRAYDEAMPLLEQAQRASAPFHPVDQARLAYWRGRMLMLRGQPEAGDAVWREMEARWPYGYYTELAQWARGGEHLMTNSPVDGSRPAPASGPAPEIKALWTLPEFAEALYMLALGEPDLATERLRLVLNGKLSAEAVREAAALFSYLERPYLQQRLVDNHELGTLRNTPVERSDLWLRAFPRPHWDVVRRQAEEAQVDPYFIFAIMREESRFFSSANSSAGARGLMQLMPATARMVAKHNGIEYDEALLHAPEFNIPLGAWYLKRVLARFDGNFMYAAAAYNAGPGNATRWVRRHGKLPLDEFVERIPFGETQRYVKRVFLSYRVYSKLYR